MKKKTNKYHTALGFNEGFDIFDLQTDFVSILVTKIEILAINEGGPNPIRPSFTFLEKVCTVLSMHFAPIEISTERD